MKKGLYNMWYVVNILSQSPFVLITQANVSSFISGPLVYKTDSKCCDVYMEKVRVVSKI